MQLYEEHSTFTGLNITKQEQVLPSSEPKQGILLKWLAVILNLDQETRQLGINFVNFTLH